MHRVLTSLEVIEGRFSYCYIFISLVRAKKLVSVEDAPSAPLRGEDKYSRMLMALSLMENGFDGALNEKSSH